MPRKSPIPSRAATLAGPFSVQYLTRDTGLGFGDAAAAIARAFDLWDWRCDANQSVVAKYSAVDFEAAAVTGLAVATSARLAPPETDRKSVV